jgi:hypothetical protein
MSNSTSKIHRLTKREFNTILAALRYYQYYYVLGYPTDPAHDDEIDLIATDGDDRSMNAHEIDVLIERINF